MITPFLFNRSHFVIRDMVTLLTFYLCHLLTYQHKIRSPYQFRTNQSQKFQEFCLQFVLIMDPFVVRKPERQIKLSSFQNLQMYIFLKAQVTSNKMATTLRTSFGRFSCTFHMGWFLFFRLFEPEEATFSTVETWRPIKNFKYYVF